MKFFKKASILILILAIIGLLFRGWFFKNLVTYKSIGVRPNYIVKDKKLFKYINENIKEQTDLDVVQIIELGLSITSRQLKFTANENDVDPNKLITSRKAHCIGYASFFATTCNYLLKKYNLSDQWTAKPKVGQLYFIGQNIHKYFNSPFFKDHDFVTIENKKTDQIFAVDPTVYDYLLIDFINYTN